MPISLGQRSRSVRSLTSLASIAVLWFLPASTSAQAPRAAFSTNPSPAQGEELLTVQFLDRSTGAITSWHWEFGQGIPSSEQSPLHTFHGFGNFDVTLTVSGPEGS